jgi:hypothetical protein
MGGDPGPHKPVHEPTTDSQFGENETGDGAVLAPPRHRFRLDDGGLSADPQRRCSRHRRRYGGGLRSEPGSQSSGPSGAHQVWPLSCAAGSPRVHSKSGRLAKKTRHSNVRRQGGATRRDDGARGRLRAGSSGSNAATVPGCVRDRARSSVLANHHSYDPCVAWGERDAVPGMRIDSRQETLPNIVSPTVLIRFDRGGARMA